MNPHPTPRSDAELARIPAGPRAQADGLSSDHRRPLDPRHPDALLAPR